MHIMNTVTDVTKVWGDKMLKFSVMKKTWFDFDKQGSAPLKSILRIVINIIFIILIHFFLKNFLGYLQGNHDKAFSKAVRLKCKAISLLTIK